MMFFVFTRATVSFLGGEDPEIWVYRASRTSSEPRSYGLIRLHETRDRVGRWSRPAPSYTTLRYRKLSAQYLLAREWPVQGTRAATEKTGRAIGVKTDQESCEAD